jgi:hypothetical protein
MIVADTNILSTFARKRKSAPWLKRLKKVNPAW